MPIQRVERVGERRVEGHERSELLSNAASQGDRSNDGVAEVGAQAEEEGRKLDDEQRHVEHCPTAGDVAVDALVDNVGRHDDRHQPAHRTIQS